MTGRPTIRASRSTRRGVSWSAPRRVDDGVTGSIAYRTPRLGMAGGDPYAIRADNRNGDRDIFYTTPPDNGLTGGDGIAGNDGRVDDTDTTANASDHGAGQSDPAMRTGRVRAAGPAGDLGGRGSPRGPRRGRRRGEAAGPRRGGIRPPPLVGSEVHGRLGPDPDPVVAGAERRAREQPEPSRRPERGPLQPRNANGRVHRAVLLGHRAHGPERIHDRGGLGVLDSLRDRQRGGPLLRPETGGRSRAVPRDGGGRGQWLPLRLRRSAPRHGGAAD